MSVTSVSNGVAYPILSTISSTSSNEKENLSKVATISSFVQIVIDGLAKKPENTLVLFDIDETVFCSRSQLGSQFWRKHIAKAMSAIERKKGVISGKNWHDLFSYELAKKKYVETVEKNTSTLIKTLQEKGFIVCGLTSRERNKWYDTPQEKIDQLTTDQLSETKVNFDNQSLEKRYPSLAQDSEYFQGTFFANTDMKGDYLFRLFTSSQQSALRPEEIIFFDDKDKQVNSVAQKLTELGIRNQCYVYTAAEKRRFDPLVASIQLHHFTQSHYESVLSDEQAIEIAKQNPKNTEDHYLGLVLDLALDSIHQDVKTNP